MKNLASFLILAALIMTSCLNQDFTITEEQGPISIEVSGISISGSVIEANSFFHFRIGRQRLHNVSVKMMLDGEVLEEVNTDAEGKFAFADQQISIEGAYLLFEAPGFHKNVFSINEETASNIWVPLVRKDFDGISVEAIDTGGPYITLTGVLQDDLATDTPLYYITNSDNEFVGAALGQGDFSNFIVTTIPDEVLYLHCVIDCFEEVFEIGPFAENTNLGALVDQNVSFDRDWDFVRVDAFDCDGMALEDYGTYYKVDGLTKYRYNGSGSPGFGDFSCLLEIDPDVIVSIITQNPRKISQISYDYSPDPFQSVEMTLCEDDDTYLNYSIGGGDLIEPNLFTFANVLPEGKLILKQIDPIYANGIDISFVMDAPNLDTAINGEVYFISYLSNAANNLYSSSDIEMNITLNDGEFIEGNFSGSLYDVFESSLENLTGSFRARIQ